MAVVLEHDGMAAVIIDEVHLRNVGVVDEDGVDIDGGLSGAGLARFRPGVGPVLRFISPVRIVTVSRRRACKGDGSDEVSGSRQLTDKAVELIARIKRTCAVKATEEYEQGGCRRREHFATKDTSLTQLHPSGCN